MCLHPFICIADCWLLIYTCRLVGRLPPALLSYDPSTLTDSLWSASFKTNKHNTICIYQLVTFGPTGIKPLKFRGLDTRAWVHWNFVKNRWRHYSPDLTGWPDFDEITCGLIWSKSKSEVEFQYTADVCFFPKQEVVSMGLSQWWIELSRRNLVAERLWQCRI